MGLEHVETIVANNQSTVDFTEVFDKSADRYRVFVDNILSSDSGTTELECRLSSDGGSTWDSGSSDYAWSRQYVDDSGSTVSSGSSGDDYIQIAFLSNDALQNDTALNSITVHDPINSNRATILRNKGSAYRSNVPHFHATLTGGQRLTQSAVDSIQFSASSGHIDSGIFSVYKVTESSGGAKQHIETIEANSQSSVDFTNVFDADDGYDRYAIQADNVIPSEDASQLQSRFSSDSGSTFDSGSSDYAHSIFTADERGETFSSGSSSDNAIDNIIASIGNDESENDTSTANILISEPTNANRSTVLRSSSSRYGNSFSGPFGSSYSGGVRLTQSAIDSIQFFMDSGDIASGTFSVYGIGE